MPTIVPMQPDHIEGFHRALDVVARERKYLASIEAPPLEQSRAFVMGQLQAKSAMYVAVEDGEVVGWCDIKRMDRAAYAHCGGLGMGVLPAVRGKGLGTALIRATLDAAWESGLVRVELSVYDHNRPAIRLYEKVGFMREGVKHDGVRIDGRYMDVIMMAMVNQANRVLAERRHA